MHGDLGKEKIAPKYLLLVDVGLTTLMCLAFDTSGKGSMMVNSMLLSSISIRRFLHGLLLDVGTVCILFLVRSVRLDGQLKSLFVG